MQKQRFTKSTSPENVSIQKVVTVYLCSVHLVLMGYPSKLVNSNSTVNIGI